MYKEVGAGSKSLPSGADARIAADRPARNSYEISLFANHRACGFLTRLLTQ
jgi:hypothetical protein